MSLGDVEERDSAVGYNCDFCIAKGLMGSRPGRLCLLYQVDLAEDVLEYKTITRQGPLNGEIRTDDDLYIAFIKLLEHHKTDRIELILKYIKLKGTRSSGLCPKSVPKTDLSIKLLGVLNLCLGGENGNQLTHMPFQGTVMNQPNIFIEAYYIWVDEYSKYMKTKDKKQDNKVDGRPA